MAISFPDSRVSEPDLLILNSDSGKRNLFITEFAGGPVSILISGVEGLICVAAVKSVVDQRSEFACFLGPLLPSSEAQFLGSECADGTYRCARGSQNPGGFLLRHEKLLLASQKSLAPVSNNTSNVSWPN